MLKSEVIKVIDSNEIKMKKLVLIRYSIELESTVDVPYKDECLAFIQSIKSLPENFERITFCFELSDRRITKREHQEITLTVDGQPYYDLVLDDDLEFFFLISRFFHQLETYVESFEELTTDELLPETLKKY